VLPGRCYEFERTLPYQPFAEALRGSLPALSADKLTGLPPGVLREVARLLPELAERYPDLAPTAVGHSGQEQARLFDGLARFLAHWSTEEALLLILEDLHWAGASTLQLLHYLARQLAGQAVLLVGTFRPEEVGRQHPLRDLRRRLVREGLAHLHSLTPLPAEAVGALLLEMSAAGERVLPLARRLYRETAGNPFFLIEVVKACFELEWVQLEAGAWKGDFERISEIDLPLPLGVSEVIQARVGRLSQESQEAVQWAAVLGREFDYEPLEVAWDRGEEATLEALDELLRRRLIEEGTGAMGRDYAFTHHKIQEAVYAGIPQRHRRHLHARVGTALEQVAGPDLATIASELAHHFLQGSEVALPLADKAAYYLLLAGDAAAQVYANDEARQHYEQALSLLKTLPDTADNRRRRVDALIQMVACAYLADSPEQNMAHLFEAEPLAQALSDREETPGDDRHRLARVHFWMSKVHYARNEMGEAIVRAEQVLEEAQGLDDPELLAIPAWTIGMVVHTQGWFGKAEPLFRQAILGLKQGGYWPEWIRAVAYRGAGLAIMGDPAAGIPEIRRALSRARELQSLTETAGCHIYFCFAYTWIGDYPAAIEHARRCIQAAEQGRNWLYVCLGNCLQAWPEVRAGHLEEAAASIARAQAIAKRIGAEHIITEDWLTITRAELALYEGRPEEARTLVEEGLAMAQTAGSVLGESQAHRVWGQILAVSRPPQWEEAEAQWTESLRLMKLAPMPLEAAHLHILWGQACRGRVDYATAREHWEKAAAQFETSGRTEDLEHTRALLAEIEAGG
jgi:tetratricopeptide (TPR) repeat protein